MPLLHPRRKVYFTAENSYEQRLRLRLRILPQPQERGRAAGEHYPRRDLRAGYKFLQAKLYRRVVFIFGGVRVARQDDGAFMRDSYKAEKTL